MRNYIRIIQQKQRILTYNLHIRLYNENTLKFKCYAQRIRKSLFEMNAFYDDEDGFEIFWRNA